MIVWKQTDRIISAGDHLLRKDPRMTLIKSQNSINLQIANVTPDDRGKFLFYTFSLKGLAYFPISKILRTVLIDLF